MYTTDLIEKISSDEGIPSSQVKKVVDALFAQMAASLASGESVGIRGFGRFDRSFRRARKGKHPATGVVIDIPGRYAVSFKAGDPLKEAVNS